jgi:hypothetical protein
MKQELAIQYRLEGGYVEAPLAEGCAWCEPLNGDTTHKFCGEHRDKFFVDLMAPYLEAFDLSDEQIKSIQGRIGTYLEKVRAPKETTS